MLSGTGVTVLSLISTVVLAANFRRKLHRVDNMLERAEKMAGAIQAQSKFIRSVARETLNMRRLYQSKRRIRDKIYVRSEEIGDLIKKASSVDCRVHVLDDRRTNLDNSFIAVIQHQSFRETMLSEATDEFDRQWRFGRRFVVWAIDKDRALDKIKTVYPPDKGFRIVSCDADDK